jgi:hypothetical protein
VAGLKHVTDLDFVHVNAQPIKQAIATWVAKWIYLFTQYLQVRRTGGLGFDSSHERSSGRRVGVVCFHVRAASPIADACGVCYTVRGVQDYIGRSLKDIDSFLNKVWPVYSHIHTRAHAYT